MPKNLRKKLCLSEKPVVKLVSETEGPAVKTRTKDRLGELKGLAKDVWLEGVSSVELVKDIRRRVGVEANQSTPSPDDLFGSFKPFAKGKTARQLVEEARKEESAKDKKLMKHARASKV